jgi:DnaJ-class molecular chaperone
VSIVECIACSVVPWQLLQIIQLQVVTGCILLPLMHANGYSLCRGKGMPISKHPGTFGNLLVKFDIVFPRQLTDAQKEAICKVL